MEIFETFRPENDIIAQFVDYYYLDIKPNNTSLKFDCFPHYNNTISLYKSHIREDDCHVIYDKNASYLQIFTPIREQILSIKQIGEVHRIVIVFKPLGIHQFYREIDFSDYVVGDVFMSEHHLRQLFNTTDILEITKLLDGFLFKRFRPFQNLLIEKTLDYIFEHQHPLLIQELAEKIEISPRHLNRIFRKNLGVSVKKFQQIVLFRKVLHQKLFENPEQNFTKLAHHLFYSDQSHLIKVFRKFTAQSPKEFIQKGTHLGNEDTFWRIEN